MKLTAEQNTLEVPNHKYLSMCNWETIFQLVSKTLERTKHITKINQMHVDFIFAILELEYELRRKEIKIVLMSKVILGWKKLYWDYVYMMPWYHFYKVFSAGGTLSDKA